MDNRPQQTTLSGPGPKTFLTAALFAFLAFWALADAHRAGASVSQIAIVDPGNPGFTNNGDLADAVIFPLNSRSDGVPGNVGFIFDTWFSFISSTSWIGVAAGQGRGPVTLD